MIETIQKTAVKNILNLSVNASDENIVKSINIGEKFFIRNEITKKRAEVLRKLVGEKHPIIKLVKNILNNISPNCRKRFIENLIINAGIFTTQKQKKIVKKLGFEPPWFFVISPTAKCNLSCTGCYAHEYSKHEGLSFEDVDRIFTEAKELGIHYVTISGGEPFMWPHLFKILEKHNDMYFLIYTNGTLINKEVAKKLSRLGNAAPGISIEGFEKETDNRRGKGIFSKVMEAMDNLKEGGVLFGFSATATKLNSETIMSDEFIDLMIDKGCSFGWFFQYVPVGKKPDVNLMSTPEQRNKLRIRSDEIRRTKPLFVGDFWNDGPYVRGCMAGARPGAGYFHINCNGDVEPCAFLQFSVDNIKGKKLVDVINSPFFKAIRREQPYCENKNLLTPCALIDNPEILRKVVKECGAKPSYNGSRDVISDPKITKFLDNYSKEYKKITDPVWENELSCKFKHWKDIKS